MSEAKGNFISFEGIDRCGKSTQARLLKRNLDKIDGVSCLLTAEPGGSGQLGTALRDILLSPSFERDEITSSLLFSADRHEHVKRVIQPSIEKGLWVICDRYVDSTMAYQGGGGGVPLPLLRDLSKIATNGLMPKLTILLSLDADKRNKRNPNLDYYDQGDQEFEQRTALMFERLAMREAERFVIIDGNQSIDAIATQVFSVVKKRLLNNNQ